MIRFIAVLIGFGLAFVGQQCPAQDATTGVQVASQPNMSPNPRSESLLIGPGDRLHIQVFGVPDLEQRVNVSDAGNANFFLLGDLHVASMSPNAVAQMLENLLSERHLLVSPSVNVLIEQSATMQVSVIGEVHSPGSFEIGTKRSILDIISLAGGLTGAADRNISIKRRGEPEMTTVYIPNNPKEALTNSVDVYPGDTVIVPQAGLIYVLGDVNRPGGYYMTRDSKLTALQAISAAGGLLPNAAAPSSKIIRRKEDDPKGYVDIPLQLRAIQNGKRADVALQPNDVIYVPFSYSRNLIIQSPAIISSVATAIIYTNP